MSKKEEKNRSFQFQTYFMKFQDYISNLTQTSEISLLLPTLFHFALICTLSTQNVFIVLLHLYFILRRRWRRKM